MLSMTGFGTGEAPLGEGRLWLEIRSLNHRFFEVRIRVPAELGDYTFFLEQLARETFSRGRYEISVRLDSFPSWTPTLALDRARAVYRALLALRDEFAPGTEVPVTALAGVPDLLTGFTLPESERVRQSLRTAFDLALEHLREMQRQEGMALRHELEQRLGVARQLCEQIAARSRNLVEHCRLRLRERVARLLEGSGVSLDCGRLEMELAILADRSDIAEELARLGSHFDQFEKLLDGDQAVGRRLDFLLQEICRETNTLGAKSQDAPLAHLVVELKAEAERMREQVHNVQ